MTDWPWAREAMATARMVWDFEPGIRTLPLRLDGCISMRMGDLEDTIVAVPQDRPARQP